jgi:DNA-binding HxlR family transcriptional regulator
MAAVDVTFCPTFRRAVELLGRSWNGAIARALLGGPLRFSQLARALPGVSDRMLAQRLKELEAEDVVVRRVDAGTPVRVEYALTAKGAALQEVVAVIERWAHDWADRPAGPEAPSQATAGRAEGATPSRSAS